MLYRLQPSWKYVLDETVEFETGLKLETPIMHPFISVDLDGRMRVLKGYAWDGATNAIDTKTAMSPSCGHDAWAQLIREGYLEWSRENWALGAKLLEAWALKAGMWKVRARTWHIAVEKFGYKHCNPALAKKYRVVHLAP